MTQSTSTVALVVALQAEARPLIQSFNLKQFSSTGKIRFYADPLARTLLAVSGTGKINAATATALLLQRAGAPGTATLNIGICGSAASHPYGALYRVRLIRDRSTGHCHTPDLLVELPGAEEEELATFEQPVTRTESSLTSGLVDMEASGFYHAASHFLTADRIGLLKIVSDHLQGAELNRKDVESLISSQLETIQQAVQRYRQAAQPTGGTHNHHVQELLQQAGKALQLTTTQTRQLQQLLTYHMLRNSPEETRRLVMPHLEPSSEKSEQKRQLEKIRSALLEADIQ